MEAFEKITEPEGSRIVKVIADADHTGSTANWPCKGMSRIVVWAANERRIAAHRQAFAIAKLAHLNKKVLRVILLEAVLLIVSNLEPKATHCHCDAQ